MATYNNLTISSGGLRGFGAGDLISGMTILKNGLATFSSSVVVNLTVSGGFAAASAGTTLTRVNVISGGILNVIGGTVSSSMLIGEVSDGKAVSATAGHQMLSAGAKAYDTVISSGGNQAVFSGAVAYDTDIYTYGQQHVHSGGSASGVILHSGLAAWNAAYHLVEGVSYDTKVYAFGDHYVRYGGVTYHSEIYDDAWQTVGNGGIASGTTIYSGALQGMYGAGNGYGKGCAYDTMISAGGMQAVESGYAERTTARNGVQQVWDLGSAVKNYFSNGTQRVAGYALSNFFYSGSVQYVESKVYDHDKSTAASVGCAVSNVFSSARQYVTNGVARYNTFQHGTQTIQGGSAVSNTLTSATQWIAGGVASDNTLYGGSQVIQGGSAVDTNLHYADQIVYEFASNTVVTGGTQKVVDGGWVKDNEIRHGSQLVQVGTSAFNTVAHGGFVKVYNSSLASNTTLHQDATMEVWGGTVKDLYLDTWTKCDFWQSAKGTGNITIAGKLSTHDGSIDGNIQFRINGNLAADYMLDTYQSAANYSISVSKYAGNGTYTLIDSVSGFDKNITIYAGDQSYGSLALDSTVTRGGRSYTLKLDGNSLKLTVSGRNAAGFASDINGDRFADVIMSHTKQGFAGAWKIGEDQKASWGDLSNISSAWQVFDMGNTSADNYNDIYLYDENTNKIGAWTIGSGGKVTGWKDVASVKSNMNVLGLGDFNGDRISDVLLRSDTGDIGYLGSGKDWKYIKGVGDEWTVAAVGDFDGDGKDDLALAHDAGFAGCFLTNDDGTVRWSNLDKLNGNEVVGAGDFNGDGVDDILLKKGNFYGAWIVENGNAKSWMSLGTLKDGNTVEQIADFNGDGVDDLRVRTAAGDIGVLCVNGANSLEWHYYGSVGSEWSTSLAATV